MTTLELQRMIIRLVGDGTSYFNMLKDAELATVQVMGKIGKIMTDAAAVSMKAFGAFDLAMTEAISIMSHSSEQSKQMKDAALKLGTVGKQGPIELAKAYYHLASAGFNAEQAIKALPALAQFATAGAFDMSVATELAAAAQASLGMKSKDAGINLKNMKLIMDTLVKASIDELGNTKDYADALARSGGAMRLYNIDLAEGVAALTIYKGAGMSARDAGGSFDRMLRLLTKSTIKHGAAMKQLDFSVFDEKGKRRGIADIIENLEETLRGYSDEELPRVLESFGIVALQQRALLPLIGKSEQIREQMAKLHKSEVTGTIEKIADSQMGAFLNQMQMTFNQVEAAAIAIGEQLAPAMSFLGETVRSVVATWNMFSPAVRQGILIVMGVTVAVASLVVGIVILVKIVAVLASMFTVFSGVIGAVLIAAIFATAMWVQEMGGIEKTFKKIQQWGQEAWDWLKPITRALISFSITLWDQMKVVWSKIKEIALGVWKDIVGEGKIDWDLIREYIEDALYFAEFALLNVEKVAKYTWTAIGYYLTVFFNEAQHLILESLPAIWRYVFENMFQIGKIALIAVGGLFGLLATGIVYLFENIPWENLWNYMFSGLKSVANNVQKLLTAINYNATTLWTGLQKIDLSTLASETKKEYKRLDDAFASVPLLAKRLKEEFKKLPEFVMPGRDANPAEEALRKQMDEAGEALGLDFHQWKEFLKRENENWLHEILPMPEIEEEDLKDLEKAGEEVTKSFTDGMKKGLADMDSVLVGSAESIRRYQKYMDELNQGEMQRLNGRGGVTPGIEKMGGLLPNEKGPMSLRTANTFESRNANLLTPATLPVSQGQNALLSANGKDRVEDLLIIIAQYLADIAKKPAPELKGANLGNT